MRFTEINIRNICKGLIVVSRRLLFINFILVNRTCVNSNLSCNCDVSAGNAGKWLSDEGYYETPDSLGITRMVFLQQKDLEEDARGRITLGPLECVETSIYKYVLTNREAIIYIFYLANIILPLRNTFSNKNKIFRAIICDKYHVND